MGFDLAFVQGEHSSHFECAICQALADMDSVLTIPCSHCFCRRCFMQWSESGTTAANQQRRKTCPTCNTGLKKNPATSTNHQDLIFAGGEEILVHPIGQNAMAFRILKAIKVTCPLGDMSCQWQGDYGNVKDHLLDPEQHPNIASVFPATARRTHHVAKKLVLRGAGSGIVNGIYDCVREKTNDINGCEMYAKPCLWKGQRRQMAIAVTRLCSGNLRWFVTIPDDEQPGTDRDIDFYTATCGERVPPLTGWREDKNGVLPVPQLELVTHEERVSTT